MAHRPALVCQHLENIGRDALESYQDLIRDYVRGRYGVYALYRGRRLRYVGLASNLATRLKAHLADRHARTWDRFSVFLTADGHHLRELECLVLRIVRPTDNRQIGVFLNSEDLLPRFRRQFREHHRRQEQVLFGPAILRGRVVAVGKDVTESGRRKPRTGTSTRQTRSATRKAVLTGLDAVAVVLREAARPLSAKEAAQAAIARRLWSSDGRTPDRTIYAALIRDIRALGPRSRFRRRGRGTFGLAKSGPR